jgi:hypothetical protein
LKKLLATALAIALGTLPVSVAIVWALWPVHTAVITASSRLNTALDGVNGTLTNINRPCKGPYGPDACGTLAQINKVSIAAGDATNQMRLQVAQTGLLITATTANLNLVGSHVSDAVDALKGTATEATNRIADLKPIEVGAAKAVVDADQLIANPLIPDSIANLDQTSVQLVVAAKQGVAIEGDVKATTGSVKAIAADGQAEVHSLTHPKPLVSIADWTLKVVHAFAGIIF